MSKGTIEPKKVRRGTGMWPLMLPRPWLLEPTPDEPVLIDPVAIASAAAHALEAVGWPGINLMEHEFLLSLVRLDDEKAGSAESVVSDWYQCHRSDVAGELRSRLATYRIDLIGPTARNAMAESLSNYEVGN